MAFALLQPSRRRTASSSSEPPAVVSTTSTEKPAADTSPRAPAERPADGVPQTRREAAPATRGERAGRRARAEPLAGDRRWCPGRRARTEGPESSVRVSLPARRQLAVLPRPRAAGARALARARCLPRVDSPAGGRRAVPLLRGPADRQRPAGQPPRARPRVQGRVPALQDHARPPGGQGGWDCHGLPVELEVEKELGFSSKEDIERYGVAEFNAAASR